MAGYDGIGPDPAAAPFDAEQIAQHDGAGLGDGIGAGAVIGLHAADRRQEHDRPLALVEHHPAGRLGAQKITLETDVDHRIPGFLGQLFQLGRLEFDGAADDAIDGAERGERFVRHALRIGCLRGIHFDDDGFATLGLHQSGGFFRLGAVDIGHRHIGAFTRGKHRGCPANTAGRAGDDDLLTV